MSHPKHLTESEFERLRRLARALEKDAGDLRHALDRYARDPGRMLPQLGNAADAAHDAMLVAKVALRTLGEEV